MIPGTILCDDEFKFSDGTTGQKLLIVLNDGQSGTYIVIKTTSNGNFKGTTYGCQSSDRYPNFFCPKGPVIRFPLQGCIESKNVSDRNCNKRSTRQASLSGVPTS